MAGRVAWPWPAGWTSVRETCDPKIRARVVYRLVFMDEVATGSRSDVDRHTSRLFGSDEAVVFECSFDDSIAPAAQV